MWRNLGQIPPHREGHIGVPHRVGAASGCHIGVPHRKKSSLLKMSQLDICVNSSVLHMHTDTPLGPRARPAAAEWAAGGDAASARKPQEQARVEALQGVLNHGVARSDMPPKKKQRRDPVRRSRRLSGNSNAISPKSIKSACIRANGTISLGGGIPDRV